MEKVTSSNFEASSVTLCSQLSLEVGEQLFGTATQTQYWFLLEYPLLWGAKAFEESELPGPVKNRLTASIKSIQHGRIQLIKSLVSEYPEKIRFFFAVTSESQPLLYEFQLTGYKDLLALDFEGLFKGEAVYRNHLRQEPLYLVCTNGRRDPCCAKFGTPIYSALAADLPGSIWQTSHVGGHRFAANLVCFPHGLFYGRVAASETDTILESYQKGEVYLEKYRGRCCYPEPVQAADYFLRMQTGSHSLGDYVLLNAREQAGDRWEILFSESNSDKKHRLSLHGFLSEFENLQSCRDAEKSRVRQYRMERYEVNPG